MTSTDARAQLLHETAEHHGAFEAVAPPHDWWDWYAAYMDAREAGSTSEDASAAADRYMAEVKHVVVAPDAAATIRRRHSPLAALDRATVWLNSEPLTAAGLHGNVVLVDFWTYSCVNWMRTLPYVRAWA